MCLWHIRRKNCKMPHLGDYYSYSDAIVQSHIAQNGLIEGWWNKWPWPTFRFSGSSTPVPWARAFIFGIMADVRQQLQSLLFVWPLPTFATVTHIYIMDSGQLWHLLWSFASGQLQHFYFNLYYDMSCVYMLQVKVPVKLRLKLIVMLSLNIHMMTSQDLICVQCVTNGLWQKRA